MRRDSAADVAAHTTPGRWRATPLTVARFVLTEEQAAPFDPLFAHLSSEWSEPMRLRAERQDDGSYLVEMMDAFEVPDV